MIKSDRTFDNNFKNSVSEEFADKVVPQHYMYAKVTPMDIIESDFPLNIRSFNVWTINY